MLFDTHCHLDDSRFDADREQILDEMEAQGIMPCVTVGADIESSRACKKLTESRPWLFYAAGVHPHDAKEYNEPIHAEILSMMNDPKCVAWGEIGLDYYYDYSPREVQREVFIRQLETAYQIKKTAIFHVRDAHEDVLGIFRERKGKLPGGILHCFSGSREQSRIYLDMGFFISLAGPVTFSNARNLKEIAAFVPLDRLLLETDSPYLSPEPLRGKRNDPRNIVHIARAVSALRGMPYGALCTACRANGINAFQISVPDQLT